MWLFLAAWLGLLLGVFGSLVCLFALLPTSSNGPVSNNQGECGMGTLFLLTFGPLLPIAGGAMGCMVGLLVGGIYNLFVGCRPVVAAPLMTVASCCPRCGRYATIQEGNVSALCPGCGDPLPLVPWKTEMPEL